MTDATLQPITPAAPSALDDLTGQVDLATLDTAVAMSKAVACEILHPVTKKGTGQKIWLLGKDSEKVQNYINGEANAQLRRNAEQQARGKQPEPPTVEKGIERQIDLLVVATDRWEGVYFNGERNAQFTVAKARELYKIAFIREQLNELIGDLDAFMTA